ncbi:MAG: glycosyltransferase family 4 protein [Ardenticatenaceae bacterium]|nr:glycosyltransferase family 4 protein [Ardenticatenaceae bacterium]
MNFQSVKRKVRTGFVSTRLAGTDGVSLEVAKWVRVLTSSGHECFYFAAESEWPADHSLLVPEAHFKHPDIQALNADLFDDYTRSSQTSRQVQTLKDHLKGHLERFVRTFGLDLLIAENALSLPMNVPLGLALTELIAETNIPTIGHHHDFTWERERYAVNAAADYLRAAFPPVLPSLHHVVINSFASRELALRTGVSSRLIPNVMDFESPPPPPDAEAADLRSALGLAPGEYFLLQPTRVVPRKRIERAIELVRRLELPSALVISHASSDEGDEYAVYLREYADLLGVRLVFASGLIGDQRSRAPEGRQQFSLADGYQQADVVTYPSAIEGFGNAFLETIYYRRPIVMSAYEIFKTDIEPKGFQVISFDTFVDDTTVARTRTLLLDPASAGEMVRLNYELGRHYYSLQALDNRLAVLLHESVGP